MSGRRAVRLLEGIYFDQWNNYGAFCRLLVYWTWQYRTLHTNTRESYICGIYVAVDIMEVGLRTAFKRSLGASEVMFASVLTRILINKYRILINGILIIERA